MEQFVTLESMSLEFQPDRNLAMELVRATEAAAIRSFPLCLRSIRLRGGSTAADETARTKFSDKFCESGVA
ncbi:MAG: hypothetical protein EBW67_00150 [Actinobacteria bacterium]|nr:hypothetical protein [Actinomycetota bacterium]NCV80452.1 hypothetical protein [Actinomycetota bacterium]NCW94913.1 hypothetical protein [Actinomycetota bacterium]